MSDILEVRAGNEALQQIRDGGLPQSAVKMMAGASGGPKWFVLSGLDKALLSEYFRDRQQPLELLGTSAGSWRFSCFAQKNPLDAHYRFEQGYIEHTYSKNADAREISAQGRDLVETIISSQGAQEIIDNKIMRLNLIAVRSHGLIKSENPKIQLAGLGLAATANMMSRQWLAPFFTRTIFHHPSYEPSQPPAFFHPDNLPTDRIPLSRENVMDAVMASGSIPVVMKGIRNIQGAPKGVYRDGGVTDYHFDIRFHKGDGLVLYPHFYSRMIPGWFDKGLKKRRPSTDNTAKVVLISPSQDFVSKLPHGKIPDRDDFRHFSDQERMSYWRKVVAESDRLGDAFLEMVSSGSIKDKVQPL